MLLLHFHYGNPIKGIGLTLMTAKGEGDVARALISESCRPLPCPRCSRRAVTGQVAFKSLD